MARMSILPSGIAKHAAIASIRRIEQQQMTRLCTDITDAEEGLRIISHWRESAYFLECGGTFRWKLGIAGQHSGRSQR